MSGQETSGGDHKKHNHNQDVRKQLKEIFSAVKNPVHILLFTQKKNNDTYNNLARQVLDLVGQISDKIVVNTYGLNHSLAGKYNVTHSPTILFEPEKYNISWLGAPVGEEGKTLVELILMIGFQNPDLNTDAARVLDKIDKHRHVKIFVSPTCPYCPQQAVNAVKAAMAKPEMISAELVDIQAFPEIADKYGAQSVPQAFANETLIALGAQTEELFAASLLEMEQQNIFIPDIDSPQVEADLVIVGGGPAGLSAGIYAARSGFHAVVLERGALGGQVATTPVVENYPGLNQVGGKALVDMMVSHALEYVNIFQGEEVMEVEKDTKGSYPFMIKTNRRKFLTRAILLATGANHRKLNIPGESRLSGRGVSYCSTCDGPIFKGKKVVIAGGGDSAATDALHLNNLGVDVTIVHWKDRLDAQDYLARQISETKIPVLYNTEVKEIFGQKAVEKVIIANNKTGLEQDLKVDGVFVAIGYEPSVDLAKKLGVHLTPAGYIAQQNYRTNIEGIYAAGDVTGGYNQIVIATGQGSAAALSIFEDLVAPFWQKKTSPSANEPAKGEKSE
jgi:thioredoxin reductase (NADPH)